jgi:hypothetical protein
MGHSKDRRLLDANNGASSSTFSFVRSKTTDRLVEPKSEKRQTCANCLPTGEAAGAGAATQARDASDTPLVPHTRTAGTSQKSEDIVCTV